MAGIDLIIFDCDGVVVDSEVLACTCLGDQLRRHGMEVTLEEVFARFLGRSFAAVAEHFRSATGGALPEAFRAELRARLETVLRAGLEPMPGVAALLAALSVPYCLASSSDRARIDLSLSLTGLAGHFAGRIFDAAMVERGKPAPDLFLHAAHAMGAAPARTLVVEDTVPGILAAKAAGMVAFGFVGGSHHRGRAATRVLAEAGADRVFGSMTELLWEGEGGKWTLPGPRNRG